MGLIVTLRILEIHIFYNCGLFYWHLIEILWLFIFLVFYYYRILFFYYIYRNYYSILFYEGVLEKTGAQGLIVRPLASS